MREAVTGKDSLGSLVPLGWGVSQLSGAMLGLIPEEANLPPGLQAWGAEPTE